MNFAGQEHTFMAKLRIPLESSFASGSELEMSCKQPGPLTKCFTSDLSVSRG